MKLDRVAICCKHGTQSAPQQEMGHDSVVVKEGPSSSTSLPLWPPDTSFSCLKRNRICTIYCLSNIHVFVKSTKIGTCVFTSGCQDTGPVLESRLRQQGAQSPAAFLCFCDTAHRYMGQDSDGDFPWPYLNRTFVIALTLLNVVCLLCVAGFYDAADHAEGQRPHQIPGFLHQNPRHDVRMEAGFSPVKCKRHQSGC